MGRSKHLTTEERGLISILHAGLKSQTEIARELGRDKSTISRELRRKEAIFFRGIYVGSQTHRNVAATTLCKDFVTKERQIHEHRLSLMLVIKCIKHTKRTEQ